jgi:hypothetical protein
MVKVIIKKLGRLVLINCIFNFDFIGNCRLVTYKEFHSKTPEIDKKLYLLIIKMFYFCYLMQVTKIRSNSYL